jgi:hypothetical protein
VAWSGGVVQTLCQAVADRKALDLPRVDVIVPFRNEARLLPAKVKNLCRLDYPDGLLRFLLIDGGSTDGSGELAKTAACRDPRFLVLRCPEGDKTRQLNLGLARCRAPWVLVTDADAHLTSGTLRKLLKTAADPRVAVIGAMHLPRGASGLDRLHWWLWNVSRRWEWRAGSASAVMGPCMLLRNGWLRQLPADVVADDLHISFAALAAGRRIALADVLVLERRRPVGMLAVLAHKVRKGRALLREVLRFLPVAARMRRPMRPIFLSRAVATLLAPPAIVATAAVALLLVPCTTLLVVAAAFACCTASRRRRPRQPWLRTLVATGSLCGLGLCLAAILCVALASLPFVGQTASFSRWRQEEI